jgi:hypothetical protein
MYILAIRAGFWLMFGYVVVTGRLGKVPLILAALWLGLYLAARTASGLDALAVVVHALLLVALALWLKITGAM